jgi:hypothetical protein
MTFFRAATMFSIFPWSFTSRNAVFGPIPKIKCYQKNSSYSLKDQEELSINNEIMFHLCVKQDRREEEIREAFHQCEKIRQI